MENPTIEEPIAKLSKDSPTAGGKQDVKQDVKQKESPPPTYKGDEDGTIPISAASSDNQNNEDTKENEKNAENPRASDQPPEAAAAAEDADDEDIDSLVEYLLSDDSDDEFGVLSPSKLFSGLSSTMRGMALGGPIHVEPPKAVQVIKPLSEEEEEKALNALRGNKPVSMDKFWSI